MHRATVAVILSNYNHGRYLPDSLEAICTQTRPADEFLVIDDGSTDDSIAVIEVFARRYPNIRILRNKRNLGLQESIAQALPLVTTDYLVWAAADDRLLPQFLERSMAALERHPEAGLCFSELAVLEGDTGEIRRFATMPGTEQVFDLADLPEYLAPVDVARRMRRAYLPITSNSVVVRRDVLLQIGGYPKDLEWHSDFFAYTVIAVRHGACVVPETLALIRANPGSYSQTGIRDAAHQATVLEAMLGLLSRPEYRDVRRLFRRCPSNFSQWHTLMLRLQVRRIRDWDLFVTYLIWKVREHKRVHGLSWPRTVANLTIRAGQSARSTVVAAAKNGWRVAKLRLGRRRLPGAGSERRPPSDRPSNSRAGAPSVSARVLVSSEARSEESARPGVREPQAALGRKFTLMIPTYDRPRALARLLTYLANQAVPFPIVVLDSGSDESKSANAALIGKLDLNVRLIAYDSSITPFEKFWHGSEEVATDYCSLCADDDLVMIESLPVLIDFLERNRDFSAAHGWYFTFYDNVHIGITTIVYSKGSIDREDPLLRLREMLKRYEAVTYGVYRSDVMRRVLSEVRPVRSLLARELLSGGLTAVAGKIARLPVLYYGRSLGPSGPYERWHPIDFLISSPEELFIEYSTCRRIVVEFLEKNGYRGKDAAKTLQLTDLIHMRYLSEYVRPDIMDYLIDEIIAGSERWEIMQGLWPRLAASSSAVRFIRGNKVLRKLRDRFAPRWQLHDVARVFGMARDRTVITTTVSGRRREYRLYEGFLESLRETGDGWAAGRIAGVIRALNAYE